MAASTTVFALTPTIGLKLGDTATSSLVATAYPTAIPLLTRVAGSDGHTYIRGKASMTVGSISTCKVGAAGSVSTDSGSAGWTANVPGGAVTGQYLWLKRTTLA
jgi:hypothetical protein